MIVQAKIKNAMADFSGISAAYHGYQDRYRKIPGDDDGAARWTGAIAGNGNGIVLGTYNDATAQASVVAANESRLWWDHLRRAGFVAGNGNAQPTNAFAGQLGVQTGNGAATASVMNGFSSLIICSANIPDKVAIAIDTSMDDGVSTTGGVRAELASTPNPAQCRNTEPTLSGSVTASRTTTVRAEVRTVLAEGNWGRSAIAITPRWSG